jgi:hypothetical protein
MGCGVPTAGNDNKPPARAVRDRLRGPGPGMASLPATQALLGTLEDLALYFRLRTWPAVPRTCPPELLEAAPAIDDHEPYVPGSFDDVVLAYDLGKLSDCDYQALSRAAAAASRD